MNTNPWRIHQLPGCEVWVLQGVAPLVEDDDNVDVEIRMDNGERYAATFFTLQNVSTLMARWSATGECSGHYFIASHAIFVRKLTEATILEVVSDLLRTGELPKWCERINDTVNEPGVEPTEDKSEG